jgi:hypothetical protein
LTLAQIGEQVLKEHGVLRGLEIERLAKQGGFKGKVKDFQSYMRVAFKRHGGFENLGRNRWKLKEATATGRQGA